MLVNSANTVHCRVIVTPNLGSGHHFSELTGEVQIWHAGRCCQVPEHCITIWPLGSTVVGMHDPTFSGAGVFF